MKFSALLASAEATANINDFTVAGIGFVIVLIALALIFLVCKAIGLLTSRLGNKKTVEVAAKAPGTPASPNAETIEGFSDRREAVAVISAVLAEEIGTDAKNIRITSIKKVN